jgi:glyoxylase-like metal-dependent hydrolase (beta-lactamase superfamily II)
MIEEISEDLFRIEIPLPEYYPKSVNAYVVRDTECSLIIDAGLQDKGCMRIMQTAIKKIGIDLKRTDFFITHGHGDHVGLIPGLINAGSAVLINRLEAEFIQKLESGVFFLEFQKFYQMCGLPEGHFERMIPRIINFVWGDVPQFQFLQDGAVIERGRYRFLCVETPGHNKGHMCLYEPDKKILISGDHLLKNAIPPVVGRIDNDNPLKKYLSSLDKVMALDINIVLPGHGRPFRNIGQRIQEIKEHHREQNRKLLFVVQQGPMTIYEVSQRLNHKRNSDPTDLLFILQSFRAAEATVTYLSYLELAGKIEKMADGPPIIYSLREIA